MQDPAPKTGPLPGSVPPDARVRMFAPSQVALGTLLGGPLAALYLLWRNFRALERESAARQTLAWGLTGYAAMVLALVLLHASTSLRVTTLVNLGMALLIVVLAGQLAARLQMSGQAIARSGGHRRDSGWRVFGISVMCALLNLVLWLVLAMVLTVALKLLGLYVR